MEKCSSVIRLVKLSWKMEERREEIKMHERALVSSKEAAPNCWGTRAFDTTLCSTSEQKDVTKQIYSVLERCSSESSKRIRADYL